MKVCLIAAANSAHTQRWVAALRGRGVAVTLLSPSPTPAPLPAALHGVPIWPLAVGRPGMSRRQRLAALLRGWLKVPGLLRSLRPDLVHLHSLPNPVAVPLLLGVPNLVVSAWGSDIVQRDQRKARWYPLLFRAAAAVTATSQDLARVVQSYAPDVAVAVVAFGIDGQQFVPGPPPHNPVFTFGALKNLEPVAGFDVLLRAFAELGPGPAGRWPRLIIGGAGSQRAALLDLRDALGLAERVTLPGLVPHGEVAAFLRSLDLFVMPSRADAFGVAALEAQACGVPVVASAVGGVPEVIVDGLTGLLVPPGDPAALRVALERLMFDAVTRRRMALAGPPWVRRCYDWDHNVDQMLAVYAQVLAQ